MFSSKKIILSVSVLILVLAAALRLYKLGEIPHGLYIDEVAMLVDAKSVSQSGLDMHGRPWYQVLYPSYGDFKLPVYIWLASVSVKFFGASDWALRLPSVIAGLGSVVVGGALAWELLRSKEKNTKLLNAIVLSTMLVIAISPWSVMFSRTGFEGHVGQFLVAVSIWLGLKSRQKAWLVVPAALIGGLATYSYFSVRFVWPVVWSMMSVLFLIPWPSTLQKLKPRSSLLSFIKATILGLILPLLLFGVTLIPMLKSPLYHDSNQFRLSTPSVLNDEQKIIDSNIYREAAGDTIVDRVFFHRFGLTLRALAENYADNLSLSFLFLNGDPNLRHGTQHHGLFLLSMLPGLLGGLLFLYHRHRSALTVVVVWWLIALLPASVPESTPHALRSLNALMPLAVLIGCGWGWIFTKSTLIGRILSGVFVAVTLAIFVQYYFVRYPAESAPFWQEGFAQAAVEVYRNHGKYPVYVYNFDEKFYVWMLAYGPLQASDFHQLKSEKFMFKSMPGIIFDDFRGWNSRYGRATEAVIVGTPFDLTRTLASPDVTLLSKIEINSLTNKPILVIAHIGIK